MLHKKCVFKSFHSQNEQDTTPRENSITRYVLQDWFGQ